MESVLILPLRIQELRDLTRQAEGTSEGSSKRDAVTSHMCEKVRTGLANTPCDVIQTPATMQDTGHRVLACMPDKSPYRQIEICKRDNREASGRF